MRRWKEVGMCGLTTDMMASMSESGPTGEPINSSTDVNTWSLDLVSRVILFAPVLGVTAWVILDSKHRPPIQVCAPLFVFVGFLAYIGYRAKNVVSIDTNALVIRRLVGARTISRSDVLSAKFGWFGLTILLRDGTSVTAPIAPRYSSTELGYGAEPDERSAAHRITRWAAEGRSQ